MSNANPLSIGIVAAASASLLTACSLLPGAADPDRPYRKAAEAVVANVERHTDLGWRCRRIGTFIVEAGIAARMARTGDDLRQAAVASALAGLEWENRECPTAAVPGLSFGTSDIAKRIARGAHKSATML